ncbi:MAG: aspartate-semialdehyde dehydrogenase, partial [Chloroflexi bacterium]
MPTPKRLNVAVVGATGMVGQEILKVLAERKFPADKVIALASERSAGLTVPYNGSQLQIQPISDDAFNGIDI